MRNVTRNQRNPTSTIPKSAWIVGCIILLFLGWRFMYHQTPTAEAGEYLLVRSGTGSSVSLFMTSTSKKTITEEEKLFSQDNKIQVQEGEGIFKTEDENISGYLDERGELAYKGKTSEAGNLLYLINGMLWLEANQGAELQLKNMRITLPSESTIVAIQNDRGSTTYALEGTSTIHVGTSTIELAPGNKITILNSEANAPLLKLSDKIETIDDTIRADAFFSRHGGDELLSKITAVSTTSTLEGGQNSTGSLIASGTNINMEGSIEITTPGDESVMDKTTFDIAGTIKNPAITKITINNKDAAVSPVDMTFIFKDFRADQAINDITYKAYDTNGTLLDRGSITVYTSKNAIESSQKPTVTSYPIDDKMFRIVAPAENPYKTTENIVRIQGSIPENVVKYITINDFRLTKYKAYSNEWYYFANKDYSTMNEGINLYTIRYYGSDDKLISERLFTIVKEAVQPE